MNFVAVGTVVFGYAFSSSMLAIINKFAVTVFPFPAVLTALQYLTCTVVVLALGKLKVLEHDAINWGMVKKFLPAAAVFYIAIFTNTELLKSANVETFIVFRSSTPLMVAIADSVFMGRAWPSKSTFASLVVILAGAVAYVVTDSQFTVSAYFWAFAYLGTITFEMVYIKHVVMTVGLKTWGLVLYNNMIALAFFPPAVLLMGEEKEMMSMWSDSNWLSARVVIPVLLSCVFGLSISFFGFSARKAISATAYTVVGVVNKLLTVLINLLIWNKHASASGIVSLLVCIAGGVIYQQTVSGPPPAPAPSSAEDELEGKQLLPTRDLEGQEAISTAKATS